MTYKYYCLQVREIMNDIWIKQTMELIEELSINLNRVEGEISELFQEKDDIETQIRTADNLIRLYRDKFQTIPSALPDVKIENASKKSYTQMLIEIAQQLGGYFKVLDAAEILYNAGVHNDMRAIQGNIYATLRRNKQYFKKIVGGEYAYTDGVIRINDQNTTKRTRTVSGVQEAIKELKTNNPQMTKKEVLNHLLRINFDFKGKKPTNAVNIVWAKLGYSKENKQQSLLDV